MEILIRINLVNEKEKKTDSNLHQRKESYIKTIHMHVQQKQNCLYKK